MSGKIYLALLFFLIVGCSSQSPNEHAFYDVSNISEGIRERTDYTLRQASEPGQFDIPEWVTLDDGLSQDEAVALALWNNAQFQADLAALSGNAPPPPVSIGGGDAMREEMIRFLIDHTAQFILNCWSPEGDSDEELLGVIRGRAWHADDPDCKAWLAKHDLN